MNRNSLEYFRKLEYDVVVKRRQGMFMLAIEELCLVVRDESLDSAYRKIEMEKEKRLEEMIELDLEQSINVPKRGEEARAFSHELRLLMTKCIVVLLLIGSPVVMGADYVFTKLRYYATYGFIVDQKAAGFARKTLERIGSMPEAKKAELKRDLQELVEQLAPFVREVKVLWQEPITEEACAVTGKLP